MKTLYSVQGSAEQAFPFIINTDTVYVHDNIRQEQVEHMGEAKLVWVYDEIQYGKDEYLELIVNENKSIKDALEILIMSNLEV